ncbi:serine--tRNA ligase (plasmid) [Bosea sp. ANAM02]|nr:serine--tRNA ligase [Bosea sp. ANAM02]
MRRGLAPLSSSLLELDDARRSSIGKAEQARERRNALSGEIGRAMAAKDLDLAEKLKAEVAELKKQQPQLEAEEKAAKDVLDEKLAAIPNMPFDDVPDGDDEKDNVVRHVHGVRPEERGLLVGVVDPKQHFELGEALGQMDFERAAKLSGSRFVLLQSQIARLSRAIGQFMLDTHTEEHGFTEVNPPLLVRDNAMFGTAQLPKFRDDQFRAGDDHWLIPTAEVPLTNLVRDAILDEEELPLRFTALTPCFRAEAGSAGRDVRGMLRQHQFEKVELVSITAPEKAREEHERMLAGAEAVLKKLDLHYRVMTLCSGDMGFASQMTFDVEVWMPGQRAYREISSVSVCGEFQARRMNARYRPAEGGVPRFVHTLNGSGTAVGRALIAVMENYQNADGSITVPEVLVPYMRGLTRIEKAV